MKMEQEKKKKEAEDAKLPQAEKEKLLIKKEAEDLKGKGNEFYKKKDFKQALEYYQQAIDKNPSEITFYSNKAAVYMEM